jgi:hypothetical protein
MQKLIIPPCPIPGRTNKNLFWILNHVNTELLKQDRKHDAKDLMNKVCHPKEGEQYPDLLKHMNDLVPFDLA